VFTEVLEHEPMTALFPTYTSLWQRAKRFLGTDLTPIWKRFLDAIEADEQRYQRELEAAGHHDLDIFGFGKFI
jgi:hypothetical protein